MSRARILTGAAALVVCGWFALAIHQSIETDAASSIISSPAPLTAARVSDARASLQDAAFLNPDSTVELLRSALALRLREYAQARALALSVARREPQNLRAWLAYGEAAYGDRPAFLRALDAIAALAPAVKRARAS